jgi:hypothetical protein
MGSAWGKEVREGSARTEITWTRTRKDGHIGVMKKDQREQSEPFFLRRWEIICIINVNYIY